MPSIPFGSQSYRRNHGNLPEWKLVNFFAEQTPTTENGLALLSRGGMVESTTVGSGAIRAILSQPGTFGGDRFTVSGDEIYRGATLLGTLNGSGPVSIAASATEVVFAAGSTARSYNGTNLADIAFPDGANVTAVGYISQLFVFLRADTGRFYWSSINDARTIDALDFASAEMDPDNLLDIQRYRGNMWLLGSSSVEPWFPTASADLPFTRINQDTYDVGVYATGCTAQLDNGLFFVGADNAVYRGEDVPRRISDFGIEERIKASSNVNAYAFTLEGHPLFAVNHDEGTNLYDAATQEWTEFKTYGLNRWRIACAALPLQEALLGDYDDGTLWTLDSTLTEDDGINLEGYVTAGLPIKGGIVTVDNIAVETNPGQVVDPTAAPIAEMRFSRNAGASWSEWASSTMGTMGQYRARARWRSLGAFDSPGAMFQIRWTDSVPRRVSDVIINESGAGRDRG